MTEQKNVVRILKHILLALGYGLLGVVVALVVVYLKNAASGPDLKPWHQIELDEEFSVSADKTVPDLAAFLDLEERLFDQLQSEVYNSIDSADRRQFNRFNAGSICDPTGFPFNWNRTFVLEAENPRAGILMLHGLSDSPYSMRALAQVLNHHGFFVVGLRLPGHGTTPAGLTHASADDFIAAVRLAARSVHRKLSEDKPFYIAGYSNGATLAIHYTLSALNGNNLPLPDGLLLVSPAVGVSPVAALAKWQRRLAILPGLEKLTWNSINPEYDPYKYNSFAVNAGDQISRLTRQNDTLISTLDQGKGIAGFPQVLALQSVADATVSTPAVVDRFMKHLAPNGHQLVLFDINRRAEAEAFLTTDFRAQIDQLLDSESLPFGVTVVTNQDEKSRELMARSKEANSSAISEEPLNLTWPDGVYSLSHVALPFPPDDPVYGLNPDPAWDGVHLGRVEPRGERNLLAVPVSSFMRLRCNPFFSYMESCLLPFMGIDVDEVESEQNEPQPKGADEPPTGS